MRTTPTSTCVEVSVYELNITVDDSMLPDVKPEVETVVADLESQDCELEDARGPVGRHGGRAEGWKVHCQLHHGRHSRRLSRSTSSSTATLEYELMLQAATENWEANQADFDAILASFRAGAATDATTAETSIDNVGGDMIKGDKIYLTELDRANAETIRTWLNDPEVHRYLLVGHVPSPARRRSGTTTLRRASRRLQLRDPRGRRRPLHRQHRPQGRRASCTGTGRSAW